PRAAELLRATEENSSHPIATSIREYVKESAYSAENATEYDGKGVKCEIDGKTVICGSLKFLKENGVDAESVETDDSAVYVAENGEISGVITFGYKIAENAAGMVREITEDAGLKTILLSGDQVGAVDRVKKATAVSKAVAGASVKYKEEYISKNDAVYVGNGIYDKTLAENAKCVIAIGNAEGKTAVADGDLRKVPAVIKLAKRTRIISKQNRIIRFIGGIFAFALAAAMKIAFGYELLWLSAIVLALSDVAAFFNSARNITETV
ncbi:MAG TPA: hypothetical protein DDW54_01785, partial [Clostridiales bacterium]|nr:hypothetical protein [Clostridiales bacterium]